MTTGLPHALAARGANVDPVLRAAGLERRAIEDPDAYIATAAFARLLDEAASASGDPDFGLHFGASFDAKDYGALGYVVLNSPTIAIAIQNIERYIHLHNEAAQVSFGIEGNRAYLRFLHAELSIDSPRQHNEYSMAVVCNTLRKLAGNNWAPREVQFAHAAPACTTHHARLFGCRLSFACAANAIVIEPDFVNRCIVTADQRLYRILKQHAERILGEMPREDDVHADVRRAIADTMREGEPTLARVSEKLAFSPRTLERRLKQQGGTFKRLVDDTRLRFAIYYLTHGKHTLTEIAFLLGYSECSAFSRAFKRWTGSTPLGYRRKKPH